MLVSKMVFDVIDRATYLNCNLSTIKGINKVKDVIYNEEYPDACKADLYYKPDKEGSYPVLINIHGGGFVAGDKKFRLGFSRDMANLGLFVVNINYGLCPEHKFPNFILQCLSSLQWVLDNSDKYNLDLDNILISGDSAGAYIAAYLGILQSNKDVRDRLGVKDMPTKIKGLILYCGPYQLESLLTKKILLNLQTEIGGAFLDVSKDEVKDIEKISKHPLYDLLNINPFINSSFPPSFLTYAKHDFLCPDQGDALIKILNDNNVKIRYHYAEKVRDVHCYHLFWHNKSGRDAMKLSREFVNDLIADKL